MANGEYAAAIIRAGLPMIAKRFPVLAGVLSSGDMNRIAAEIAPAAAQAAVKADPVAANQTNNEPLIRSRVTVGIALAAVGLLAGKLGFGGVSSFLDPETIEAVTTVIAACGIVMAFLGRVRKTLAPLGGWNPLRWLGLMQ